MNHKLLGWLSGSSFLLGSVPYTVWSVIQVWETGDPTYTLNDRLESALLGFWAVLFAISVMLWAIKRFGEDRKIYLCFFNKLNFLVLLLILLALFFNYE